ncbi:hypothetical protein P3T27_005070 [Kitasatospora sp. MAA19]|nr:hypothetical protein [Kitasatospora sp. MAA19]
MSAFVPGASPAPAPPASTGFRLLRAVPFATLCVVLAAAGHVLASGAAVSTGMVFLGWVLALGGAVLGARRERSLAAITGGLAVGQLGLHLLFHAAQTPSRVPAMPKAAGMAEMMDMPGMPGMGMVGGAHSRAAAAQLAAPLVGGSHASAVAAPHVALWCHAWLLGLSPAMFIGHLAATLVAAWWLRRGEAAVWRLVRTAAEAVSAVAQACAAKLRAAVARLGGALSGGIGDGRRLLCAWFVGAGGRWRLPVPVLLRHCVIRRGPPAVRTA